MSWMSCMFSLSNKSSLLKTTFFFLSRISSASTLPAIRLRKLSPLSSDSCLEYTTYLSVPQSCSLIITSCDASQSFLVKYPDSAVLNAVSAFPFLHACAEIKYSIGLSHSTNEFLIGSSMISPCGLTTNHFIPAICVICVCDHLAHESTIV